MPKLPDKVYDWLKWIAVIALPSLETAILAFGKLYGFDATIPAGTVAILAMLLGSLIGLSTISYNKHQKEEKK